MNYLYEAIKPTRLYIKQCPHCGLKYFGKSTRQDIEKYPGSGTRWNNHLNKHGVEPTHLWNSDWYHDTSISRFALKFSRLNKIVSSKQWANLAEENGFDGGPHFKGKKHSLESRKKMGTPGRKLSLEARQKISESNSRRIISEETRKKISIKRHMASGKTFEEAIHLAENKPSKVRKTKSQAMKDFYKDPSNKLKKAEQMRKLHNEYDLDKIKLDYDLGLKPKEIMKKYNMTKNRYDHIRSYYLK